MDRFRRGPNFLTIDPDECIDCELAKLPNFTSITKRRPALPQAEEWKDKTGKLPYLIR